MMIITANEVKKNGVSMFDGILEKFSEIVINFRGKNKYVVMDIQRYKELRALELDRAYEEVMKDYKNGDYRVLTANEHLEELEKELNLV